MSKKILYGVPLFKGRNSNAQKLMPRSGDSYFQYETLQNGLPESKEWTNERAVKEGMKISDTVYSCISKWMSAISQIPWKAKIYNSSTQSWDDAPDCELQNLIDNPNVLSPILGWEAYMELMIAHTRLCGNFILKKVRNTRGNKVIAIMPLPPDRVYPIKSNEPGRLISHYEYVIDGKTIKAPVEDIVHYQKINPANFTWGIGPLQAGALTVDVDVAGQKWQHGSLRNMAAPPFAISFNKAMTKDQMVETNRVFKNSYDQTMSTNARSPILLGDDAKISKLSFSAMEMDYVASRRASKEDICSMFDVPPCLVQIGSGDTKYSNFGEADKSFQLNSVVPEIRRIRNCLNSMLVKDDFPGYMLDFDTSGVPAIQDKQAEMEKQKREREKTAIDLLSRGAPLNMVNEVFGLGLGYVEGGDIGGIPNTWVPLTSLGSQPIPEQNTQVVGRGEIVADISSSGHTGE